MSANRNLFLLGRRPGDEDQLTEMLAWLAGAVPAVANALIALGVGERIADAIEVEVSTQKTILGGRLDAILLAPSLALVVESKLGSGYREGQLRKYMDWLAQEYPNHDRRCLMTLTRDRAPWPNALIEYAGAVGVIAAPRRWEELHDLLDPFASGTDSQHISARLVREFLDMLSEEGMVPIQPLRPEELGDAWSKSRAVIRRYHEFFGACKSTIAEVLDAEPHPNSQSSGPDYVWQDFTLRDGARLIVGFWFTDKGMPVEPYTHAPTVWMAALAKHLPDWESVARSLEKNPPDGWRLRGQRWWGRPEVWCYLSEALGEGTFDEQRVHLAATCRLAMPWLQAAGIDAASLETAN